MYSQFISSTKTNIKVLFEVEGKVLKENPIAS